MEPEFALEEKHWGCISGGQTKAILEGWMALYSVLNVQLAAYSRVMDDQWHTSRSGYYHMTYGHLLGVITTPTLSQCSVCHCSP